MTSSGTKIYSFPVDEIIRSAIQKVGGEWTSADEQKEARKALSMLLLELTAEKTQLASIKEYSVTIPTSATYVTLENGCAGIIDAVTYSTAAGRRVMQSISFSEYSMINNPETRGTPSQYSTRVSANALKVNLYPANDTTQRTLYYNGIFKPDFVTSNRHDLDINDMFIPCLIFGLAYKLSFDRRGIDYQYRQDLFNEYNRLKELAKDFDKERTSMFINPRKR